MRRWSRALVIAVALLVAPGFVIAGDAAASKVQAQRLVDEGSMAYERADFATALRRFEDAFAAYPSAKLWFNIGQAERALGRPVEALHAFQRFVAEASDAGPEQRVDAQVLMGELERSLGRLHIVCSRSGADIVLDGRQLGSAPLPGLVWATTGHHVVAASDERGASARAEVDVSPGAVRSVELRLPEAAPPLSAAPAAEARVPEPPPRHGWWLGRTWTWVAAGGAVVLAGGAITSGLLMRAKLDELKKSCGSASGSETGCSSSQIDAVDLRRDLANGLWIATGAAVVTASVLFFVEGRTVTVSPMAGSTLGVAGSVRF